MTRLRDGILHDDPLPLVLAMDSAPRRLRLARDDSPDPAALRAMLAAMSPAEIAALRALLPPPAAAEDDDAPDNAVIIKALRAALKARALTDAEIDAISDGSATVAATAMDNPPRTPGTPIAPTDRALYPGATVYPRHPPPAMDAAAAETRLAALYGPVGSRPDTHYGSRVRSGVQPTASAYSGFMSRYADLLARRG